MRILHVISMMASVSGGTTQVVQSLASSQVKAGQQVAVCTTAIGNRDGELLDVDALRAASPGVRYEAFPWELRAPMVSLAMRRWLREHLNDFDLLHVHGLYRFPPSYAAWLAHRRKFPYIAMPHGNLDPFLYRQSRQSVLLKRLWERWFDVPNLNGASAIHYTTEEERDRAGFLKLRAPSFVVPNGLDWPRFAQLPARGEFRARLGIGDAPLVLFLSRINFKKGLDLLVPAFAQVRSRFPDAVLAMVGPDNEGYGSQVRSWVAEHALQDSAQFVDHLDGEAVLQAYVDADVFALPSYTENFGMVVAESLACGTPVVISDQVNIHREVSEAGAGLVTRCDVAEVADALCTLLPDAPRRQAMGRAGRDLVQRKWTWDVVAQDLSAEYEQIIARHSRRRAS